MNTPSPSERATGVKTDGKSHLNLTRTMADVWGLKGKPQPHVMHRDRGLQRAPREVIAHHKIPYAGKPR